MLSRATTQVVNYPQHARLVERVSTKTNTGILIMTPETGSKSVQMEYAATRRVAWIEQEAARLWRVCAIAQAIGTVVLFVFLLMIGA